MVRFFSTILMLIFLAAPAAAGDGLWDEPAEKLPALQALPVTLREKATVDDEYIRLGDLFSGLDEKTDKKVAAPAPALGKEVILTAEWLKNLTRVNKISWTPADDKAAVTVRRNAEEIDRKEIARILEKELTARGMPDKSEISLQRGPFPILVPVKSDYRLDTQSVTYDPFSQNFEAKMTLVVDGKESEKYAFSGKARTFILVPTARRDLTVGQIITESDIFMKNMPQDTRRRQTAPARQEDLIGKELKRSTRAGQILSEDDVRTKVMVAKGKLITLNFSKGGIMLTTQGKALENGGLGDTVRVMNTQSKAVVQGTVTGPETVLVTSGGMPLKK